MRCFRQPLFTAQSVAPADQASQFAVAIHQRHRHAIDFRLHPQCRFILHPVGHRQLVTQLAHAGMRHRMQRAAVGAELCRIAGQRRREAALPLL